MMFLRLIRRQYCRARMAAYVSGEMSPQARRTFARWMDADDVIYAEYRRAREAQRTLNTEIPALGHPTPPALDRIWSSIQNDLSTSKRRPSGLTLYKARYGVICIAVGLMMVMPVSFGSGGAVQALPQQPLPQVHDATAAARTTAFVVVDLYTDEISVPLAGATLQPQTAEIITRVTPTPSKQQ